MTITPAMAGLVAQISVVLLLVALFERRSRPDDLSRAGRSIQAFAYNTLAIGNLALLAMSLLIVLFDQAATGLNGLGYAVWVGVVLLLLFGIHIVHERRAWNEVAEQRRNENR